MISRYDVALNGIHMNELSEELLILDVNYPEHEYSKIVYSPGGTDSQIYDEPKKGRESVSVTFELHVYSIIARQEALQSVIAWAKNGGVLEINDRPEQRLRVVCEQFPNLGSVRNWTDPLTIVFSAYAYPYWEDLEETVRTLQGSNVNGSMDVPGIIGKAKVDVTVKAQQTINSLVVTVGGNVITLSGISCPSNGQIIISHDDRGILSIKQGSTSLLSKRTATSADDLVAECGKTTNVGIRASGRVTATFRVRGCWL